MKEPVEFFIEGEHILMFGDYVGVILYEDREPVIDFLWVRNEYADRKPWIDDDSTVDGGLTPDVAMIVAKELLDAVRYINRNLK